MDRLKQHGARICALAATVALMGGLAGCAEETTADHVEDAGQELSAAAKDMANSAEGSFERAQEASSSRLEAAGESVAEAAETANEEARKRLEAMGDAVEEATDTR